MLLVFDMMSARFRCSGPIFAIRLSLAILWAGQWNRKCVIVSGAGGVLSATWQDGQLLVWDFLILCR